MHASYELTILLPMRFRPWYPGEKYWIDLTPEELAVKQAMAACYASQRSQNEVDLHTR